MFSYSSSLPLYVKFVLHLTVTKYLALDMVIIYISMIMNEAERLLCVITLLSVTSLKSLLVLIN